MSTPTERRYRREARYSKQLRVTVEPATAAALEAEADAAGVSVSAVIRDAVARGLPLMRDARRKAVGSRPPDTRAARVRRDRTGPTWKRRCRGGRAGGASGANITAPVR